MIPRKVLLLTAVAAGAVYAGLWSGVFVRWSPLVSADLGILRRFHDFGVNQQTWLTLWRLISDLFGPNVLRLVGLIGIVIALIARKVRVALFLAITVIPAGLVTGTAKALSGRPRPETALTRAASTSFPSGHALGITVGVLALGTLLWPWVRPSWRVPLMSGGAVLIFVVGLSRVVLNVHHPSDVIAGWALGLLYYALCMLLVPPYVRPASAL